MASVADLDRSFEELSTCDDFFSESLRGKVRSIQMRPDDAIEHFERAEKMSKREPDTPENALHKLNNQIYALENALLRYVAKVAEVHVEAVPAPPAFERAIRMSPEIAMVVAEKTRVDALMLLHTDRCDLAVEMFGHLVRDGGSRDGLPGLYLGLAASQFGIGEESKGWDSLDAARLATQAAPALLSQALASGALVGVYSYLDAPDQADCWRAFLERLDCPQKTKAIASVRGESIRERSEEEGRLLVF